MHEFSWSDPIDSLKYFINLVIYSLCVLQECSAVWSAPRGLSISWVSWSTHHSLSGPGFELATLRFFNHQATCFAPTASNNLILLRTQARAAVWGWGGWMRMGGLNVGIEPPQQSLGRQLASPLQDVIKNKLISIQDHTHVFFDILQPLLLSVWSNTLILFQCPSRLTNRKKTSAPKSSSEEKNISSSHSETLPQDNWHTIKPLLQWGW